MASPQLTDWTDRPERFFRELPPDWRAEIEPLWPQIAPESRILVFAEKGVFKGGGILSRAIFPDMAPIATRARQLYDRQYWYVGFLFVSPGFRSEGLGSRWLEAVRTAVPARGFWLVIEKLGLLQFYARSGFHVEHITQQGGRREWLLVAQREDW